MARRQYFTILVCALAVLVYLFVWRGYGAGFIKNLSDLPAGLLSRVSYIAQMTKNPALNFSEEDMEGIKRELELEITSETPEAEQKEELLINNNLEPVPVLPLPELYAGISKERLDWINLNALSKEMIRETQVLLKQAQSIEQKSEKAWSKTEMHTELKEIQEEAQILKQGLDEFSGDGSEITDIQIDLIQVLVQLKGLETII